MVFNIYQAFCDPREDKRFGEWIDGHLPCHSKENIIFTANKIIVPIFFVCSPTSLKQDEFTYEESAIIYQLLIFMPQTRTDYLPMAKKSKLVFPLN